MLHTYKKRPSHFAVVLFVLIQLIQRQWLFALSLSFSEQVNVLLGLAERTEIIQYNSKKHGASPHFRPAQKFAKLKTKASDIKVFISVYNHLLYKLISLLVN
jgi:hypothetical protein